MDMHTRKHMFDLCACKLLSTANLSELGQTVDEYLENRLQQPERWQHCQEENCTQKYKISPDEPLNYSFLLQPPSTPSFIKTAPPCISPFSLYDVRQPKPVHSRCQAAHASTFTTSGSSSQCIHGIRQSKPVHSWHQAVKASTFTTSGSPSQYIHDIRQPKPVHSHQAAQASTFMTSDSSSQYSQHLTAQASTFMISGSSSQYIHDIRQPKPVHSYQAAQASTFTTSGSTSWSTFQLDIRCMTLSHKQ